MSHKRSRRAQVGQQQHEPESEGGVATAVPDTARSLASNVASAAEQAWDGASHGVQYAASAATQTAEAAWDGLRDFLRRYPIATFCAGAAVGALAALALERLLAQARR